MKQKTLNTTVSKPENESKHTLGEAWIDDNGFIAIGKGEDYMTLADLDCSEADIDEREANKERFVKCWNSYDDMLEALKRWVEYFNESKDDAPNGLQELLQDTDSVIEQATNNQ